MTYELSDHQKRIDAHLQECPDALIFVSCGVGKTLACIHRLVDWFLSADHFAALVVAPKRVATLTWPCEIQQFHPWLSVANLREKSGQEAFLKSEAHVYLINYDSIHKLVELVRQRGGTVPYDVVIFDESTKLRDPSGKRAALYRKFVPRVERQVCLSGTPIPNSLLDLWGQVMMADGGKRLTSSYYRFRAKFFRQESSYQFAKWVPFPGADEKIQQLISDITLTIRTNEFEYEVIDHEVPFSPELRKVYKKLERDLVIQLSAGTINVANAAVLVTKLLQMLSGAIYDESGTPHFIHNCKLDELRKLVDAEPGPVLCAIAYRHEIERIRKQFPEARFFEDAKSDTSQHELLQDWNAGKIKLLVAHPASVSHGLNLQKSSHVIIWLTLTYSRELFDQMVARLARRGQSKVVKVIRLLVSGTADDAVCTALERKSTEETRLIKALEMLESFRDLHHTKS